MHTETMRVRKRIDQAVHEAALRRNQLGILSAARVDAKRLAAEHRRDIVGIQAGGVDDGAREDALRGGGQLDSVRTHLGANQGSARQDDRALVTAQSDQRAHERFGFENAGVGGKQRCVCGDVRLARADERAVDHAQTFDAVGFAACLQRFESAHLLFVVSDDQLPAAVVRHAIPLAELIEQSRPLHAVARLQRSGRVVDAGVHDLTVVCARAHPGARVPFEDAGRTTGFRHGQRCCQADDTAADDRRIDGFHALSAVWIVN
jgi:hypothetical protein